MSKPSAAPDGMEKAKRIVHWALAVVFLAALALAIATLFSSASGNWPEAVLLLAAVFSTLAAVARQLPLQNVLGAAVLIALVGGGISALDAKTGIPFGEIYFSQEIGPQIPKILPWATPLIWLVAILNSRGVARLVLRPWRKTKTYGFRLIGLTALLAMAFDLALEPFAVRVKNFWLWSPTALPLTWQGAPLVNFFSWLAVTILILALVTPLLINKKRRKRAQRDFYPLAIWLGGILFFGIACAQKEIWPVIGVDGAMGIIVAVLAICGAQW